MCPLEYAQLCVFIWYQMDSFKIRNRPLLKRSASERAFSLLRSLGLFIWPHPCGIRITSSIPSSWLGDSIAAKSGSRRRSSSTWFHSQTCSQINKRKKPRSLLELHSSRWFLNVKPASIYNIQCQSFLFFSTCGRFHWMPLCSLITRN